jgi:transposase
MNDKILEELKEQSKWLRFLAFSSLKNILEKSLETKEQKMIYELSDGKNSTNDIAKKLKNRGVKVSHMTVYNYWRKWYSLGIVEPSEKYSGRYQKIVSLEVFNIK